MPTFPFRAVLTALALGSGTVLAQPVPPTPPARPPTPAARPAPQAAHSQPRPAPLVRPRPGAPAQRPHTAPRPRPQARPPTPAIVPAPPAPEPEKPAEPGKGSNTGQPLPRFASLRSDEVNLRTGPGTRYPIEWVYKRRDLPVQIEREFEIWRLIRDQEGVKGWVHQAVLVPRRTAVILPAPPGAEPALRRDPKDDAAPVARLKPGVIIRIRSCEATSDWCQAGVQDYRGWIRRSEIWGTMPGEAIQ